VDSQQRLAGRNGATLPTANSALLAGLGPLAWTCSLSRLQPQTGCIGSFRSFWDYSGGTLTDWGVHLLDVVHWAMGIDAPKTVSAFGGKYVIEDNGEIPDTLKVVFEYPASPVSGKEFVVTWSNRHANSQRAGRPQLRRPVLRHRGHAVHRPRRLHAMARAQAQRRGERLVVRPLLRAKAPRNTTRTCSTSWSACARAASPTPDVETTHRSTSAPHVANIAFKLGRKLRWNRDDEQFLNDPEANKLLTKQYRKPWNTI